MSSISSPILSFTLDGERSSVSAPDSGWFFPLFILMWLAISAALSLIGGWHALADRFASMESVEGDRYRFRTADIGWGPWPVSYGACLFLTVGPKAFSMSVLFVFRFLHPRLVIPWDAVERCDRVKFWLMNRVAVHVKGSNRRILFPGVVGERIFGAWTEFAANRASSNHRLYTEARKSGARG